MTDDDIQRFIFKTCVLHSSTYQDVTNFLEAAGDDPRFTEAWLFFRNYYLPSIAPARAAWRRSDSAGIIEATLRGLGANDHFIERALTKASIEGALYLQRSNLLLPNPIDWASWLWRTKDSFADLETVLLFNQLVQGLDSGAEN